MTKSVATPDLAILLAAAYATLTERLGSAMLDAKIEGMRPAYGFVIRAVAAETPTINRLAELLDVSKQAASKLTDEMVAAGFLVRQPDAVDRRRVRLELTRKGRAARDQALETSTLIERELARSLGRSDVDVCRRVLTKFLEKHGRIEEVLARRSRAPWK